LGFFVWLMTIGASATINYLAGAQYGRTEAEAQVFALLGIAADIWKALGPLFIVALWRGRRRIGSLLATAVWIVCFAVAAAAALGLAAQVRDAKVAGNAGIISDYAAAARELADIERKRANRAAIRSSREIESAIEHVLSWPISGRGTVRSLSEACGKDHARSRQACAEVAGLRAERAVALERERLDDRAEQLRGELSLLRDRGGAGDVPDSQATLIERLSLGWLPAAAVGLALTLMIGAMIELVSAFAPLVIQEYVALHASRTDVTGHTQPEKNRKRQRQKKRSVPRSRQDVYDYLARRIRPDEVGRVTATWLFADYAMWCADSGRKSTKRDTFHAIVDEIAKADLGGKIARHGDVYHGLALGEAASQAAE
jgi:hypothetical protein